MAGGCEPSGSLKCGKFLDWLSRRQLFKEGICYVSLFMAGEMYEILLGLNYLMLLTSFPNSLFEL